MGDKFKDKWMSQLPYTLLGRRIAFQPDLNTSSALLTFGASPTIPGLFFPSDNAEPTTESLLKQVQMDTHRAPVPMSRHCPPLTTYMPPNTVNATHVYVKIDQPQNLGEKWAGPYPIIDRPSNSTIQIRVGFYKSGLPRVELHSWDR